MPCGKVAGTLYHYSVFIDTSAFLAKHEDRIRFIECFESIGQHNIPTFTTNLVLAECHLRLLQDINKDTALSFIKSQIVGDTKIIHPTIDDEKHAIEIIEKYLDLRLTMCDAVSAAVMKRIGIPNVFTDDRRDFQPLGFVVVPPLDL